MPFQPLLPFGSDAAESASPRLADELARVCREKPLEEKVFVAPSLAIGHQLVEAVARCRTPWVHMRVETVRHLAHSIVGPSLAQEGLTLLSRAQALALVEQACSEALEGDSYFGRIQDRPGLHRALQNTFDELRGAGISAAAFPVRAFPDGRKAAELASILNRYEELLSAGKFLDGPGVLRRALQRVASAGPESGPWYLVPSRLELSGAERELMEKVAGPRWIGLLSESLESWRNVARSARLFRAIGEENEVREVFRRLVSASMPIDQAELLYTDPKTYSALVYELASQYAIPCTFAGGIAVAFSRPGQAAVGFLDWIGGGFEEDALRSIVSAGAVDIPGAEARSEPVPSIEASRVLRAAAIGWGRNRHVTGLDRLIRELGKVGAMGRRTSEDDPDAEGRNARRARTLAGARAVRSFLDSALRWIPSTESGRVELPALARATARFVAEFGRVASAFDGTSREALMQMFSELEALPASPLSVTEATGRLIDAVKELHVDSDRPRSGALHVSDYRSGGYSDRKHTFIVGLDNGRHPGSGLQDPVLLDQERRDINAFRPGALAIRGDRPTENTSALQACVARLSGEVTLSFSSWNLLQGSDQFPAPFLLEAYRQVTGTSGMDYSDLLASLPESAGFLPEPSQALDETEWALARLRDFPGGAAADSVRAAFPWLADGHAARLERASERFTSYDGVIGPIRELDPRASREPISASRIQTLAKCPYAYFLNVVLGLTPPEEFESDPRQWLVPKALGALLHDVFARFLSEISSRGERPSVARHARELEDIAEASVNAWRERVPPRSAAAFAQGRDAIAWACRTFLREEEEHCRFAAPRYFEVPFGLARAELDSAIASRDPVEIVLGPSESFRLRGRIDRVDEGADGTFHVWDYKTGSAASVSEEDGLHGGRQVQYALYAAATEQLLARVGKTASVSRSGYFFPGLKGQGQRIEPRLDGEDTRRVVTTLFDLLRDGAFPHTSKKDDCAFCDFRSVCGSVDAVVQFSSLKFEKTEDPSLAAFRSIRDE